MEFGAEVSLNLMSNSEEVLEVNGVGAVEVNIILEMLEHVHVIVGESISSNSWEGEGIIVKFPGVDFHA